MPIKVNELDTRFKDKIMKEPGGEYLSRCFACGTCSASCPVREIDERFNPRKIIRMSLLGMKEEVIKNDFIWLCTACYMCQERCPQDVVVTELMNAIKNVAVKEGYVHPSYVAQYEALDKSSRLYEVGDFENKKREKMGLPPLETSRNENFVKIINERVGNLLRKEGK